MGNSTSCGCSGPGGENARLRSENARLRELLRASTGLANDLASMAERARVMLNALLEEIGAPYHAAAHHPIEQHPDCDDGPTDVVIVEGSGVGVMVGPC